MALKDNKLDWAALDEITNRILDYAMPPRLEQNEQNEQVAEDNPCAIDSERGSNVLVAQE